LAFVCDDAYIVPDTRVTITRRTLANGNAFAVLRMARWLWALAQQCTDAPRCDCAPLCAANVYAERRWRAYNAAGVDNGGALPYRYRLRVMACA